MIRYALLPRDRPMNVYQWQQTPVKLAGGSDNYEEQQSNDVILPYWMGRVVGVIPDAPY